MPPHDRSDLATQVLTELSRTVLTVGALLDKAFDSYSDFEDWVMTELPLNPHTAERIRAMYLVHHHRPGEDKLPDPWKALWSLDC